MTHTPPLLAVDGMEGRRLRLISAVVVAIIGGSLFDLVTGREHWPFSPYPMYARLEQEHLLSALRLFGVPRGAGANEMPLVAFRYIQPFDQARLQGALRRINRDPRRQPRLKGALADCLERYEARRRAGQHDGPPLRGIRLYRVTWKLDPWARNVDRPDRKELILEIMRR